MENKILQNLNCFVHYWKDEGDVDHNFRRLQAFTASPKEHLDVSEQLQEILPLGFFNRLVVIVLNAFCMQGTVAELVAGVVKEYSLRPTYVLTDENATYLGFNRHRLFKVADLTEAHEYVKTAQTLKKLYNDFSDLEIYVRSGKRWGWPEMLGSVDELQNHF